MKRKYIFIIFITLIMSLCLLTGCSNNQNETENVVSTQTTGNKTTNEVQKEEQENKLVLRVFAWKGIFCFDKTPLENMIQETFSFSKEGLGEIRDWLNEQYILF